jgi:hypothetical protein
MRTTVDLDDDLVAVAKPLAREKGMSLGRLISELAQQSLAGKKAPKMRNGFPLLTPFPAKRGAVPPTLELINRLRDED